MTERSDNAKAAARDRYKWAAERVKKFAKAFEPHPRSTPAGHKGKGKK